MNDDYRGALRLRHLSNHLRHADHPMKFSYLLGTFNSLPIFVHSVQGTETNVHFITYISDLLQLI